MQFLERVNPPGHQIVTSYPLNGLADGRFSFARARHSLDGYTALNKSDKAVNNFRSYCYGNDLWCQNCVTCFDLGVHQSCGHPTTVKKEVAFLESFPS